MEVKGKGRRDQKWREGIGKEGKYKGQAKREKTETRGESDWRNAKEKGKRRRKWGETNKKKVK